jgi:hypothetical protein
MRVLWLLSGLLLLAQPASAAADCDAAFDKIDENSRQAKAAMDAVSASLPEIPENYSTMPQAEARALEARYCAAWRQAPKEALLRSAEQGLADAKHAETICAGEDKNFAQSEVAYSEERKASVERMIASFDRQCRGL